jgi:hypothetical protein
MKLLALPNPVAVVPVYRPLVAAYELIDFFQLRFPLADQLK